MYKSHVSSFSSNITLFNEKNKFVAQDYLMIKMNNTMIIEKYKCTRCKSENIHKNGEDSFNGRQKYHYLNCNSYGTLNAESKYSFSRKKEILYAYFERPSMGGIERIFN